MEPVAVSSAPVPHAPVPRSPELEFSGDFPRHWLGGDAVASHLINAVNLLFPVGERFFVRSVKHFLPQITDEALRARVRGFFGQEGRHAQAHERFFDTLTRQGYPVNEFIAWYEKAFMRMERMQSPALNLAVTVALEHYTAIMAEYALSDPFLDAADPQMRRLLLWHASEEIEHRSVAFDVLKAVDPSYGLRIAGMGLATAGLLGFWAVAVRRLWAADGIKPSAGRRHARAAESSLDDGAPRVHRRLAVVSATPLSPRRPRYVAAGRTLAQGRGAELV